MPISPLKRAPTVVALLALLPLHSPSQARRSPPSARAIVDSAAATFGGLPRLLVLDAWVVEGRGRENLSAELQGEAPDAPTWRAHEERLGVVRALGRVGWERKTPRNDHSLRWRRFIWGTDSSGVVDWVAGFGRMRRDSSQARRVNAMGRRVPHLLVAEIAGRAVSLESRGTEDRLDLVATTLADSARLLVGVRRRPRVIERVEYDMVMPGYGPTVVRWSWFGWRRDAELGWVPAGHRVTVGGVVYQEVRYSRYQAGSALAEELVRVPRDPDRLAGKALDGPVFPSVAPPGDLLAPGVHLVEAGGFRVLAVEFASFLALVEAPESHPGLEAIPAAGGERLGEVAGMLESKLGALAPALPIRYLILSHHHDDHLGAAGALASPKTTVLVAPSHAAAAARALANPPGRMAGSVPDTPAKIETVRERRVITDGQRRLEVINVGPNPHTAENLFVWLPAERIAFQGDLFYFEPDGAFPPSGRGTMNTFFAAWLARNGISPLAVYGVHNQGAAGPEALAAARTLGARVRP